MQGPQDIGWRSLVGLLQALIPALFMNIHIVGLNQVFDINIDKVCLHPLFLMLHYYEQDQGRG